MNTKEFFCLIMLAFSLSSFTVHAETKYINDPMKYAEDYSRFFGEGDSNDSSGWGGCVYIQPQADALTRIYCVGTREILVHGGNMVEASFTCDFTFSDNLIVSENCQ